MGTRKQALGMGITIALLMVLSSLGLTNVSWGAAADSGRAVVTEPPESDVSNNDDFLTATEVNVDDYIDGMTGLGDTHRIDTYVVRNIPAGRVINASCYITVFNNQALIVTGWNKYHADNLAWSNREDNPDRRRWEAITFLAVTTGDYYIQLKPIAGSGNIPYRLNIGVTDPEDITTKIGTGGSFGGTVAGTVSSLKWYPGHWYKFQLTGEQGGMNDYFYVNVTEPGAATERLWGDIYIRSLEPESWSYWLNHSWWLDSFVQNEEAKTAACYPGARWYYMDMQAYNTTGQRREDYELRMTKTYIDSDGDNHPLSATTVTYEQGKTTIRKSGEVRRGPDMFDWYKVYLDVGEGVSANLTLLEKSTSIFRLSIYRNNITSPYAEKGYDLMSSWTNKPAESVLNRINALTTNVTQAGWYYIAVVAQIGLVPNNVTNLADWTINTAWARYNLDITLPDRTIPPEIMNEPGQVVMSEDTFDTSLKLFYTGSNNGVFTDADFGKDWGESLTFSSSGNPNLQISIANLTADPEATVNITPNKDWNGETNVTFTATDLYGKTCSTTIRVKVNEVNDAPQIRAKIPDFSVQEGAFNNTMKDIELFQVFTDPDFPPFGDDNLTFSVKNETYPAWINGSKLTFGQAPGYPGKDNRQVTVEVTARDKKGLTVTLPVTITVINLNRGPEYCETHNLFEISEDEITFFDLNYLFTDPDGDPLSFAYLGGASDNLTIEIAANGSAVLRPSPNYYVAQELVRFRAIDPLGLNRSGELMVRVKNINDAPYLLAGGQIPDPLEDIRINEGEQMTFRVTAADIDNKTSELRYTWFIDDTMKTLLGTPAFTWKAGFDTAGTHAIRCRISDGLAYTDAEWNITVNNTNQVPFIVEFWPQNNTEVDYNKKINFCATAVDADGDPLTFFWRLSDGTLLKSTSGTATSQFGKVLSGGKQHIVVLEVQDGKGGVARHFIYIKVKGAPPKSGLPGFEALGLFLAIALAGIGAAIIRRRD